MEFKDGLTVTVVPLVNMGSTLFAPMDTMDGELFVSFWNSGDDYAMMTESEFEEYLQQNEMHMGGM